MKLTKNLNFKQKSLVNLAAIILVTIIIFYFFVYVYIEKVKTANKLLIEHRVQFETNLIKEEKFAKIRKNLNQIESELNLINKAFINENNKLEFITMLEGLASKHNVEMEIKINFDSIDPKDKSIILNLNTSGSYKNLLNLLQSLENLDFYVNIDNLSFSNSKISPNRSSLLGGTTAGSNNLNLLVQAKTYWR